MNQCRYPVYHEEETFYISSFGLERDGLNAFWGPGRRTECIVHYVLSGEGYFNGHPVHENQGFYFDATELVEYYPNPDNPWTYFWMDCSSEFAKHYLCPTLQADNNGVFEYGFKNKLLLIIDKIMSCEHPMGVVESLGHAFSVLMLHVPQSADTVKSRAYVRRAKNYIESNINRRITVRDVADAISINDRYLYTLFMKYDNMPPKEFILKRKIETAADLLENTELTVMEISAAVGFTDVYSFSKTFKCRLGLPPTKYRSKIKDE